MRWHRLHIGSVMVVLFTLLAGSSVHAQDPAGAWMMVSYEGGSARGTPSGLLLLADGHFSLTYAMDDGARRIGRAHAGTYEVTGNKLTYHATWSLEWLSGTPSVAPRPVDRDATFVIDGETLTVTFTSGSVQKFRRAR